MRRSLSLLLLLLLFCSIQAQQKKVLFLGNSYTGANNLPNLVFELATSAGDDLYVERSTPGGYTLGNPSHGHLYTQYSLDLIASQNWDYVVLQEQSQYPVIDYYRDNYTYPGGFGLDSVIKENDSCSQTLFYMTWGRKYGGQQCIGSYCSIDFSDYAHMQDSLAAAYLHMSNQLSTPVAPVGMAWRNSIVSQGDPVDLFSADGSHPSLAGSYLAACVFYASIFHKSPQGITYHAGLEEYTATYLQNIAHQTVFNNLETWNIDTTTIAANFDYEQWGDSVFFSNESRNADQYFWDFGNGDSDTTMNPVYGYSESGSYKVSLTSYRECKTDSISEIIDVVISGSAENKGKEPLILSPNPSTGWFRVQNISQSGEATMRIRGLSGLLVWEEKLVLDPGVDLYIENLKIAEGVYTISLTTKESIQLAKFVVK